MKSSVLIVEDEARIRDIVRDYFTAHGLDCDLARDGEEALDLLRDHDYDAILLDIFMPHLDGFEVCAAVRRNSQVPILFLTALGGEEDMLRGYALGCDDYVTKPFSLAVLLAKTQALIRRSRGGHPEQLTCGAITVDTGSQLCMANGQPVKLPPRDYALLCCLLRNRGQVLSRSQLLDKVWGLDFDGDDRTVDVRIRSLRAALGQRRRADQNCLQDRIPIGGGVIPWRNCVHTGSGGGSPCRSCWPFRCCGSAPWRCSLPAPRTGWISQSSASTRMPGTTWRSSGLITRQIWKTGWERKLNTFWWII